MGSPSLRAAGRWAQVGSHVRADIKTQGLQHPHPTKCVVPILHCLPLHIPSLAWDEALAGSWRHNPSLTPGPVRRLSLLSASKAPVTSRPLRHCDNENKMKQCSVHLVKLKLIFNF